MSYPGPGASAAVVNRINFHVKNTISITLPFLCFRRCSRSDFRLISVIANPSHFRVVRLEARLVMHHEDGRSLVFPRRFAKRTRTCNFCPPVDPTLEFSRQSQPVVRQLLTTGKSVSAIPTFTTATHPSHVPAMVRDSLQNG